jgi:hypothetical protein
MKLSHVCAVLLFALTLLGCANSVSKPVAVQPLAAEQKTALRISDVTSEASPGVVMTQLELERISQRVKAEIGALVPSPLVAQGEPPPPDAVKMKLVFVQYDRGNAFARFMLAGLGQIRIKANALLIDATGTTIGQYEVSKVFAFGGAYGVSTRPEDVEVGFAKSVAEIVKTKVQENRATPSS